MSELLIYPTPAAASRAYADRIARISEIAMSVRDRFIIALAGGSTPRMAYDLLSSEFAPVMDWESTYVFWGDERCVPPESPQSNLRMARETLLNHVRVPIDHLHRIHGEFSPDEAARLYEDDLRRFFGSRGTRGPRFDALLLGLGTDGHIASLLPGSPALDETRRWVTTAQRPEEPFGRVTLTFPAINSAANIVFLVTGKDKADVVARVISGDPSQGTLPAQQIKPIDGNVIWVLDEDAAAAL
jgi:6-phosphogluconolactonase